MLYEWSQTLIDSALATLTSAQKAAIDLENEKGHGFKKYKQSGFATVEEYHDALESAKAAVRAYFAEKGINKLSDLSFPTNESSNEGRLANAVHETSKYDYSS